MAGAPSMMSSMMEVEPQKLAISTPSTTPGSSPMITPVVDPANELYEELGLCVGSVVQKRGSSVVCPSGITLTDAADMLMEANRTAALVADDAGVVLGVFTVNDLLVAFVEGVGWEASLLRWLRAGDARMPEKLVSLLSVRTATTLKEAASLMKAQKGTDHASHHVVVKDVSGYIQGVLSSLDIARGLCGLSDQAELIMTAQGDNHVKAQFASTMLSDLVHDKTVQDGMKTRGQLPLCPASAPLAQAFRIMFMSRQNCVAVVDQEGDSDMMSGCRQINGVITPRDLLRAFAEHVSGETTAIGWLRGLDESLARRTISPKASLVEAADLMATHELHHLVVVDPDSGDFVGILSALDLVCAIAE
mmetsp:Transcript_21659/g.50632  ORF Transcript_21659/g.50632 Transcript_21659/m.50632 type:complete len:362 (-) Transcript_21659:244-1329(-)|eukprot:CAMPEP_0178423864 /NCGR_PEP_ID=MMETSP0689_2-20121128/27908_1 /TAXON_ID=160604 /ORGANISM="Amphidinium massartii, Strain CS-259" /LENGTH=361 /DNA_ID=CAMNT_0020045471 /DNA_START=95 /DNA_END=1180 /DNA_ORIENTATION=+